MQNPPPQWSMPPSPRRSSGPNWLLIGIGLIGGIIVLCCGGIGTLFWRAGGSDLVACTNLTAAGEYKKAIPACRLLVAKLPNSAGGHNNLGWCLTLDGQTEEGLSEAQKAVELEPSRTFYDTLAMAQAMSGQGQEALNTEKEFVMVDGKVANDAQRVTLGMVYYSAGRKEEAKKEWAIAAASSNAQAKKLAREFEAKYR